MKDLDYILGQEQAVKQLKAALESRLISHAYLFLGPDGVGKRSAACSFAGALNCHNPIQNYKPCGECASCQKMKHDNYPDLHIVEPQGQSIKIDQIREIQSKISYKKLEDKYQIVIIDHAQKMTVDAANSILKVLEEPPQSTVFILIADNSRSLLTTILSRCQLIRFVALAPKHIEGILVEKYGIASEEARRISLLSGGSVKQGLQIKEGWGENSNWRLPNRILSLLFVGDLCDLMRLSADLEKEPNLPIILSSLIEWFRDAVVWIKTGNVKLLNAPNIDTKEFKALENQARKGEQAIILLNQAMKNLKQNANARLTIDVLFLKLCFLFNSKNNPKGVT
jgi:DNA polymerase-3 subunit delta'